MPGREEYEKAPGSRKMRGGNVARGSRRLREGRPLWRPGARHWPVLPHCMRCSTVPPSSCCCCAWCAAVAGVADSSSAAGMGEGGQRGQQHIQQTIRAAAHAGTQSSMRGMLCRRQQRLRVLQAGRQPGGLPGEWAEVRRGGRGGRPMAARSAMLTEAGALEGTAEAKKLEA
jgi:hypothetical protein